MVLTRDNIEPGVPKKAIILEYLDSETTHRWLESRGRYRWAYSIEHKRPREICQVVEEECSNECWWMVWSVRVWCLWSDVSPSVTQNVSFCMYLIHFLMDFPQSFCVLWNKLTYICPCSPINSTLSHHPDTPRLLPFLEHLVQCYLWSVPWPETERVATKGRDDKQQHGDN